MIKERQRASSKEDKKKKKKHRKQVSSVELKDKKGEDKNKGKDKEEKKEEKKRRRSKKKESSSSFKKKDTDATIDANIDVGAAHDVYDEDDEDEVEVSASRNRCAGVGKSVSKLAIFVILVLPVVNFAVSLIFGVLLAMAESWSVWGGFLYVGALITAACNPYTNDVPSTDIGNLLAYLSGMTSLGIVGVTLTIVTGPIINPVIHVMSLDDTKGHPHKRCFARVRFVMFLLVLVPIITIFLAFIFGAFLSVCEPTWTIETGFWFILSELSQMTQPFTNDMPVTIQGLIYALLLTSWSNGFFAIIVALLGCPVMNTLIVSSGMGDPNEPL